MEGVPLMQQSLEKYRKVHNAHRIRKQYGLMEPLSGFNPNFMREDPDIL